MKEVEKLARKYWWVGVIAIIFFYASSNNIYPFGLTCPAGQTAVQSCSQCGEGGWAPGPISSCVDSGSATCSPVFEGQRCRVIIGFNDGSTASYFSLTSGTWQCSTTGPSQPKTVTVTLMQCNECCIGEPTPTTTTTVPTPPSCTPSCDSWGSCIGGQQTRNCRNSDCSTYTDVQGCTTPVTTTTAPYTPTTTTTTTVPTTMTCQVDQQCRDAMKSCYWMCANGLCQQIYSAISLGTYPNCGGMFGLSDQDMMMVALIIIVVAGGIFVIMKKKKSRRRGR